MGGTGSGRYFYNVKTLVEDCYPLSVKTIKENLKRVDKTGFGWRGEIYWLSGGSRDGEMNYSIKKVGELLIVKLRYKTNPRQPKESESFDYDIRIQHSVPNFGGKRYWFTCPLIINDRACNRKVGKLYLPPGGKYFGCRHCYDLTYTSSRESHKYDGMWRSMGFDPSVQKLLKNRNL